MKTIRPERIVSFLIPSRGRFDSLIMTLNLLTSQIPLEESSLIEFIIRLDSDDEISIARLKELDSLHLAPLKIIIAERLAGRSDIYHYYNDLAKIATGKFLLMWHNDAIFNNHNWFNILIPFLYKQNKIKSFDIKLDLDHEKASKTDSFIMLNSEIYKKTGIFAEGTFPEVFLKDTLQPLGLISNFPALNVSTDAWEVISANPTTDEKEELLKEQIYAPSALTITKYQESLFELSPDYFSGLRH